MKKRCVFFIGGFLYLLVCGVQADVQPDQEPISDKTEFHTGQVETTGTILIDRMPDFSTMEKELKKHKDKLAKAQVKLKSAGRNLIDIPSYLPFGCDYRMDLENKDLTLLVPGKSMKAEVISQLSEDMQIMTMILKETAGPDRGTTKNMRNIRMGGWISAGLGRRSLPLSRAVWLDDYGVIFTLAVDFPLISIEGNRQEETKAQQDSGDEIWRRSRNRLKGVAEPEEKGSKDDAAVFDPAAVERFQKRMIETLKHASNIRNLEAGDKITVVIRSFIDGDFLSRPAVQDSEVDQKKPVSVPTSVMTLQVAKSRIDEFSAGAVTLEEFTKMVSVVVY